MKGIVVTSEKDLVKVFKPLAKAHKALEVAAAALAEANEKLAALNGGEAKPKKSRAKKAATEVTETEEVKQEAKDPAAPKRAAIAPAGARVQSGKFPAAPKAPVARKTNGAGGHPALPQ